MNNKMATMEMKKLILSMAFPIMISMLVQALYNIVDSIFIAHISQNALTAVSLAFPIQTIMIAFACGTAVGVNTLISRYLGEKKEKEAIQIASHGILLSLLNGLIFALFGIFGVKWFLSSYTSDPEIILLGQSYLRICLLFSFSIFIQITYERIMQATGHSVYNMVMQGMGAIINIILDPILIFGLQMGVTGAAIATVTGQIIAMAIGIWITKYKIKEIEFTMKNFSLSFSMIKNIYEIGIPAILMQSLLSIMNLFMNSILVSFNVLAVSVFGIYFKISQFVYMPVNGINNAIIPVVSFNYGAKNKERIHQALKFSLFLSIVLMSMGTLLFQFFPESILFLFDANEELLKIGIPALRTISIGFIFSGISIIFCSILQATNKQNLSLLISLMRQIILLIPLVYVLMHTFGLETGWMAFPLSEGICMILCIVLYKKKGSAL